MGKLDGIPKIVYINLDSATDRREHIESQFASYGITNYKRFSGLKAIKSKNRKMKPSEYGCMMSHLRIIEDFYKSGEDQLIVVEDDIDISSIENWDFTWKELIKNIPSFDILQLVRNSDLPDHARLKVWDGEDKSTGAYIITREYAKKIIDIYNKDRIRLAAFPDLTERIGPVADFALYSGLNALSVSIFKQKLFPSQVANIEFPEWFVRQHTSMEKFWSNKHGLEDVVGHIKK